MIERIFPSQIDNAFRGHRLAVWIFALLVLLKLIMGTNSMVNTRAVATGADGIPLDSFGAAGAATAIALFASLGLCKLVLGLQGAVVLIRYRAFIPFMYVLMLVEQAGGRALALTLTGPVVRSPVGFSINLALLGLLLAGLVLSLLGGPAPGRKAPAT